MKHDLTLEHFLSHRHCKQSDMGIYCLIVNLYLNSHISWLNWSNQPLCIFISEANLWLENCSCVRVIKSFCDNDINSEGFVSWRVRNKSICSILPEINSDASGANTPPPPPPFLRKKPIKAPAIRGSTPLEMSTSRPSLCCRLSLNESFNSAADGRCLWPICFPLLLKSGWLN